MDTEEKRVSPANVTHQLKGIHFPAGKEDLMKQAKKNRAERRIMENLQKMPERQYGTMADVMKAFGRESKRA